MRVILRSIYAAYTSALGSITPLPLPLSWNKSAAENWPEMLHSMFLEQLQSAIPTIELRQREPTVSSGHWQRMSPANTVHVPPF